MKITDFLGFDWDIDCVGCAIAGEVMEVPGGFIQKTRHFCVHQDPLIPLPGFLVVASLSHIRSISDMQLPEYEEFSGLVRAAHTSIKESTGVEHLTLVQEESSIHFHLWFFPWTHGVIKQFGSPSLVKIRKIMDYYRKQPVSEDEWTNLQTSLEKIKYCWKDRKNL